MYAKETRQHKERDLKALKALRMKLQRLNADLVEKYDVTDSNMFPIFQEDLKKLEVNAQEMIYNIQNGREFFLYTCMIKADFLELRRCIHKRFSKV